MIQLDRTTRETRFGIFLGPPPFLSYLLRKQTWSTHLLQRIASYLQKRSCKWLHHVIFFQSPHHDAQTLPQRRCLDHAGGSATEMLGPCQGRRAKPCRRVSMDDHGEGCDASERITMLELAFCFASTGQIQSWNHYCFLLQPISELETQLIFATTRSFFCYNRCLILRHCHSRRREFLLQCCHVVLQPALQIATTGTRECYHR